MIEGKYNKYVCPVCGNKRGDSITDKCGHCGWANDPYMEEHPNEDGGENSISLLRAKKAYDAGRIDIVRLGKDYTDDELRMDSKDSLSTVMHRVTYDEVKYMLDVCQFYPAPDNEEEDIMKLYDILKGIRLDGKEDGLCKSIIQKIEKSMNS